MSEVKLTELRNIIAERGDEGLSQLNEKYGGVQGLAKKLGVDLVTGLSDDKRIQAMRTQYGENQLPDKKPKSFIILCLEAMQDPFLIILAVAGMVQIMIGSLYPPAKEERQWIEGVAICITVIIVVLVGALTDYQKEKQFQTLKAKDQDGKTVNVFRNGKTRELLKSELVVGDIYDAQEGNIVPADGILISGNDLMCDESSLTGEPDAVKKNTDHPYILSGTKVDGSGKVLIVAVGVFSEEGIIKMLITGLGKDTRDSLLDIQTEQFGGGEDEVKESESERKKREEAEEDNEDNNDGKLSLLFLKLEKMAIRIGYLATGAGSMTFLVMTVIYVIRAYGMGRGGSCQHPRDNTCALRNPYDNNNTVVCTSNKESCFKDASSVSDATVGCGRISDKKWTQDECTGLGGYYIPSTAWTISKAMTGSKTFLDDRTRLTCTHPTTNHVTYFVPTEAMCKTQIFKDGEGKFKTFGFKGALFLDGFAILNAIIIGITVLVVAIPEGLPLAVNISLAFSVLRMFKEHNLVRVLAASEIMGNATTVCSDKTGTLTENRMSVIKYFIGGQSFSARSEEPAENKALTSGTREVVSGALVYNCADKSYIETFANEGVKQGKQRKDVQKGNKTECALLTFSNQFGEGLGYEEMRQKLPSANYTRQFPFNSTKKRMSTVVSLKTLKQGPGFRLYCKGASEILLRSCSKMLKPDGTIIELSDTDKDIIMTDTITAYASDALRVILIAYKDFSETEREKFEEEDVLVHNMTIACIVGIADPLRKEVPDAIRTCNMAGVTVRMCTGDNVVTARAIARNCNILPPDDDPNDPEGPIVMEGPDFRARFVKGDKEILQHAAFQKVYKRIKVVARCSPTDKHSLVKMLIKQGEVVAVTGDGTNDAPALKAADVGFSMQEGTDVAKEASDIQITNNNFASVVTSISWGRNVYDSIAKFLQFQLTINVGAVLFTFVASVYGGESPMSPIQLLWVNLMMDSLASLALATERPTPDLLLRKPYKRTQGLISPIMWRFVLGHAFYQMTVMFIFYFAPGDVLFGGRYAGKSHEELDSGMKKLHYASIFTVFCCMQIVNQINARKVHDEWNVFQGILKNPWYIAIELFELAFQIIIMVVPGIREVLGNMSESAIYHEALDEAVLAGKATAGTMRRAEIGRAFGICACVALLELAWNPLIHVIFPKKFCDKYYRKFAKWCSRTFTRKDVPDPENPPKNEDEIEMGVYVSSKGVTQSITDTNRSTSGTRSRMWAAATRKLILQQRVLHSFRSEHAQMQLLTRVHSSHIGKRILQTLSTDQEHAAEHNRGLLDINNGVNHGNDIHLQVPNRSDGKNSNGVSPNAKSMAAQAMWQTTAEKLKFANRAVSAFREAGGKTTKPDTEKSANADGEKSANADEEKSANADGENSASADGEKSANAEGNVESSL